MENRQIRLRTTKPGYVTIAKRACKEVAGFEDLYLKLERSLNVNGRSKSTFTNYGRQLAHLALHYKQLPTMLNAEQVLDYLHLVKLKGTESASFFKFTVYSMRLICRLNGLPYHQFCLPVIQRTRKLPTVLNKTELKQLIKSCVLLKHRLLLGLCYGCGLRCGEVRNLRIGDVDIERKLLHVRQGKGRKDRLLPLGRILCRGINNYLQLFNPGTYLFEGHNGNALSQRGAQWVMSQAVKKAGIVKIEVSLHTLRHSFATHLLEQGVNILTIKELLGHSHIHTTMIYLHLAQVIPDMYRCPLDKLYHKQVV